MNARCNLPLDNVIGKPPRCCNVDPVVAALVTVTVTVTFNVNVHVNFVAGG